MTLEQLLNELRRLIETDIKRLVDEKIRSFIQLRSKDITEIFKELCFCILAAGYSAEKSLRIQERINDGFLKLPEKELVEELRRLGHRYPETRAKYIVRARRKLDQVKNVLDTLVDCKQIREWLVENIDGLGYKEASHFLRNIGCLEVAIIDFHILNLLEKYEITEKPRTLTRKKYLEIEKTLEEISRIVGLKPGELDLYLWYMETGKIVK
ncbi:MAG: N-glycosylase/DNA lyase [Nitrososphaerota archaeon]